MDSSLRMIERTTQGGFYMEYKRHGNKKAKTKKEGGFRTAVFIILSVILIAVIIALSPLGNYLMENVISPLFSEKNAESPDGAIVSALKQQDENGSNPTNAPSPTDAHETITLEETPFYILQMGAYTDPETAGKHADEIRLLGAGGTVYKDGSVYRVFAAAYLDSDSLSKVQSQVRNDGFEATPYLTDKRVLQVKTEGDPAAIQILKNAANTINEIPIELSNLCLSFDKEDVDFNTAIERIMKWKANCNDIKDSLNRIKDPSIAVLGELYEKYLKNISTFLDEHDTIQSEYASGDLKHLQLSIIIDYILFFEQK